MASDDPIERYGKARDRLEDARESGEIAEADAERIARTLDAKDERKSVEPAPESGTCTLRSLESYCRRLVAVAKERELTELDVDGVNRLVDDLRTGGTDVGPADGYANGSMKAFAGALTAFYEVNEDLGVDPDRIASIPSSDPAIDSRTVLTREDVDAMREAITNSRDRALFELLTFTMQRIRAIQTLRVRDIDLEEEVFYLNSEADGLKGASGKRPLLNAVGPVRRWLQDHPTKDPDDYLITPMASASRGTPGEQLTQAHINRRLRAIRDRAEDVDKPVNAHAFRHYGVTVARRVHDMSWDEIAFMGGWSGPETPRRIYEHLSDEDYIREIEIQFGIRDPEEEDEAEPVKTVCQNCDTVLQADAKACPGCGASLTADAQRAQESLQQDVGASKVLAELEDTDVSEEDLEVIANDDALLAKLIELRSQD